MMFLVWPPWNFPCIKIVINHLTHYVQRKANRCCGLIMRHAHHLWQKGIKDFSWVVAMNQNCGYVSTNIGDNENCSAARTIYLPEVWVHTEWRPSPIVLHMLLQTAHLCLILQKPYAAFWTKTSRWLRGGEKRLWSQIKFPWCLDVFPHLSDK